MGGGGGAGVLGTEREALRWRRHGFRVFCCGGGYGWNLEAGPYGVEASFSSLSLSLEFQDESRQASSHKFQFSSTTPSFV